MATIVVGFCADGESCAAPRDPLLEPTAIFVPSEPSTEPTPACGSPLAHADSERPERSDNCRSCVAEIVLLPWLLSCPATQNPLPVRTLCDSFTPLHCWWWLRWRRMEEVPLKEGNMDGEDDDVVAPRYVVGPILVIGNTPASARRVPRRLR
jgi:hypothetical protein